MSSEAHVCVITSERKLPQRLMFITGNSNEPLLVKQNGLEPNEFIDLSHEILFHPKSAEISFI